MTRSKGRTGRPWRRAAARVKRNSTVCWLCGTDIDTALDWRHPMSFTVDHVVALALGGSPTDPNNLRPAHRKCNSSRGTGTATVRTPTSRAW